MNSSIKVKNIYKIIKNCVKVLRTIDTHLHFVGNSVFISQVN